MFAPFGFYSDFNPGEILWITATPTDSDQDSVISNLTGFGFTVTVVNEGTGPYDANNYQAVFIHEDVNSGTGWNTLSASTRSNTTSGLATSEQALIDDIYLDINFNATPNETSIVIDDNTHPVTSGYSGTVNTGGVQSFYDTSWSTNGQLLASRATNTAYPAIVAYEVGDTLGDGTTQAPGRRIFVPFGNVNPVNSDGIEIWTRAIRWVAGDTRL